MNPNEKGDKSPFLMAENPPTYCYPSGMYLYVTQLHSHHSVTYNMTISCYLPYHPNKGLSLEPVGATRKIDKILNFSGVPPIIRQLYHDYEAEGYQWGLISEDHIQIDTTEIYAREELFQVAALLSYDMYNRLEESKIHPCHLELAHFIVDPKFALKSHFDGYLTRTNKISQHEVTVAAVYQNNGEVEHMLSELWNDFDKTIKIYDDYCRQYPDHITGAWDNNCPDCYLEYSLYHPHISVIGLSDKDRKAIFTHLGVGWLMAEYLNAASRLMSVVDSRTHPIDFPKHLIKSYLYEERIED